MEEEKDDITNYHVPINRDSLNDVIPAGNEIIYSTNMRVEYAIRNTDYEKPFKNPFLWGWGGALANKLGQSLHDFYGDYYTDALITYEGIALNLPSFRPNKKGSALKEFPPNSQYVLWKNISFSKNGALAIKSVFNCKLSYIPEFETEEKFNNRKACFYDDVTNLRSPFTVECIKKARASLDLSDDKKALEWIEKGFNSNVHSSELDRLDDLRSLKAQITRKETEKRRKMVEGIDRFLVSYLQSNAGKAFTVESMIKRLVNEVDNRDWLEYLGENIEGVLNRLAFSGAIKSNKHEQRVFYFS